MAIGDQPRPKVLLFWLFCYQDVYALSRLMKIRGLEKSKYDVTEHAVTWAIGTITCSEKPLVQWKKKKYTCIISIPGDKKGTRDRTEFKNLSQSIEQ